ncbi:DUF4407 domain-containing protein [Nocardia goodfellowii]|uniref:Membrane protein implicated in regulation of membrane protease activity n=1 Tax=Nocardia goodfellowii TaxID=882446 RepID=A0ABS4QAM4_9NOCA|nr:DUF4407 domain-containing protein [Nocardia goodfellowii]MBP2188180.1 membrane protein implicated in regulation of membrane protease activity [Nocardia goodfellowii]
MTVTGLLTWLGGGLRWDTPDRSEVYRHEHSDYAVTGAVVALFAVVAGVVTTLALAAAEWSLFAAVPVAVVVALLAGAVGRALATVRPSGTPDRSGQLARIGVAVLVGVLIAELASTVLFGGTVDRLLDEKAQRGVESAPAVLAAHTELDSARADRGALDQAITQAQTDIDRLLVIARCEFNPSPECPRTRITGVPGNGPEARTANEMLDDARRQLATAQGRVEAANQRISEEEKDAAAARTAAFADADRGLGARWLAVHDHAFGSAGALLLWLLTVVAFTLLALLPLLLRWWRGSTSFDRRNAFRTVQDEAERAADAAIAVKRAEVRAEAEKLRAEQQLTAARLAAEADTAIDRERQRTRVIAAIGGLEIGINEPERLGSAPRPAELPAGKDSTVSSHLPATVSAPPSTRSGELVPHQPAAPRSGGLELPIIGQVPFSDTAARWIRPLVPSFVANAVDTATHPLRTARQAFEEVEEITFTLRRTRKVTVDTQDSPAMSTPQSGYQLQTGSPQAQHIAATVVDADYAQPQTPAPQTPALPDADRQDELSGPRKRQLFGRRGPRELPPGN